MKVLQKKSAKNLKTKNTNKKKNDKNLQKNSLARYCLLILLQKGFVLAKFADSIEPNCFFINSCSYLFIFFLVTTPRGVYERCHWFQKNQIQKTQKPIVKSMKIKKTQKTHCKIDENIEANSKNPKNPL